MRALSVGSWQSITARIGSPLSFRRRASCCRYRRLADRRFRLRRWHDTVGRLLALQAEYAAWYDALPDSLRHTPTAAALQAIVDLDLDGPRRHRAAAGYGRD